MSLWSWKYHIFVLIYAILSVLFIYSMFTFILSAFAHNTLCIYYIDFSVTLIFGSPSKTACTVIILHANRVLHIPWRFPGWSFCDHMCWLPSMSVYSITRSCLQGLSVMAVCVRRCWPKALLIWFVHKLARWTKNVPKLPRKVLK